MTRSGKRYPENEVVGVAKWRIIKNLVKGSSMRQKLPHNKGYFGVTGVSASTGTICLSLQLQAN